VTTLTLGYAIFLLPVGALTDRFGERRTLSLGLIGLSAGMLLVAGAPTYALLLAAVFLLGSVYSTAMPGTNKAVYDSVAPGRQNMAMGIKQVGVTGGSGISALLVTGLAGYFLGDRLPHRRRPRRCRRGSLLRLVPRCGRQRHDRLSGTPRVGE